MNEEFCMSIIGGHLVGQPSSVIHGPKGYMITKARVSWTHTFYSVISKEVKSRTSFITIIAFDHQAKKLARYGKPGLDIVVTGRFEEFSNKDERYPRGVRYGWQFIVGGSRDDGIKFP